MAMSKDPVFFDSPGRDTPLFRPEDEHRTLDVSDDPISAGLLAAGVLGPADRPLPRREDRR